ncbi:DUF1636 family protein [Segnochrobactraceae bacterium EtOH-i3]
MTQTPASPAKTTDGPERVSAPTCLAVCTACRGADPAERPGIAFAAALSVDLADRPDISVRPVECLSVCRRAVTLALSAPGRWTYVVGDLTDIPDAAAFARAYADSPDGIVPWRTRPVAIRKGVVARVPPLPTDIAP